MPPWRASSSPIYGAWPARLAARLAAIGINTPLDLKRGDPRLIRERLGVVTMRLALELRGEPCLDLEREIPDRKSIMASRSFRRPVTTLADMREAIACYTARAAEKLRRQHLAAAHLMVFVETNRFKPDEAQHYAARTVHLPDLGPAGRGWQFWRGDLVLVPAPSCRPTARGDGALSVQQGKGGPEALS
jgi:nucleotidyltransferase/DNA polymerase involved in DNA repair